MYARDGPLTYLRVRPRRLYAAELPDLMPEIGYILGGPFIEPRVVQDVQFVLCSHMFEELVHRGR